MPVCRDTPRLRQTPCGVRDLTVQLDHAALTNILDLYCDDAEGLQSLVASFALSATELSEEIALGVERLDARTVGRAAHTLKSSAGQFGATELARLCGELERRTLVELDWPTVVVLSPKLAPTLQEALHAVHMLAAGAAE